MNIPLEVAAFLQSSYSYYLKKVERWAPTHTSKLDDILTQEVFGWFDGVMEVLSRQGSCEVGGVAGDHDHGEQVPHARNEPWA